MTNTTTKYPLLREAYAIIDGVPDRVLDLAHWSATGQPVDPHRCGTLGCAAGLLAVHPAMNEAGLFADGDGTPIFKDRWAFRALVGAFRTDDFFDTLDLFGQRGESSLDTPEALAKHKTDKALWLYRVRAFLRSKGEHVAIEEPTS
jgi:hypothetical protein